MGAQPSIPCLFPIVAIAILTGLVVCLAKWLKPTGDIPQERARRTASTALFIIGAVPLVIYPVIMIANVMSLAGEPSGNETGLLIVVSRLALTVSSAYPLTYVLCFVIARNSSKRILLSLVPIIHLVAAVLLFLCWQAVSP